MNKPYPIVIFSHRTLVVTGGWVLCGLLLPLFSTAQDAQEIDAASKKPASEKPASEETAAKEAASEKPVPIYPLSVAVSGNDVYTVDLDLPGVWKSVGGKRELFVRGSRFLKKPLNRPRAITIHPSGGIIVGDSPTREIYRIESPGSEPKPLNDGYLGNVMSLAVHPDGRMLYVGDVEKRALFRLPIDGGKPELVARVDARGLAFDADGKLWAVTPNSDAIVRIDVETNKVETIVSGRPYQYPNSLAWSGDSGYVTDTYSNCIWKFTADGKTEKWYEGDPLERPVGIWVTDSSVFVADPKQKQVYEIDRETKKISERL